MFSNLAYLLSSKSITLYILYTLHVMLGTSLVFTALYTYGVHSSKAMARAAALEASVNSGNGITGFPGSKALNGSAVEFEEDMGIEMDGMDIAMGGLNQIKGMRQVKSMIGLSSARAGWENASTGLECVGGKGREGEIKFREICYSAGGKEGMMDGLGVAGKGMALEIS
ncbi:hypothetical protein BCIN_06g02440 [Botrytis cinerea B05.10]|uniref:Uncharacterized protein n=3 Tax=Botryotinia fuckeliana TaxID=40559 RepID=A0A384JJH5_BOTFB|nr:hypothetical protein BCIN_06g02440 [Botrytis cinerea B05.10]ATZ50758.1 hypothetical protein BCIN_06g02440 [Botrytis cinerea B05.10]EMR88503.1 hypothetical protein BcDW1_2841 [Botrytis cinerea BcDW1]CCD49015.1 hypothetical protein BofuT4_P028910.1 [Botrytis cinerea T4]